MQHGILANEGASPPGREVCYIKSLRCGSNHQSKRLYTRNGINELVSKYLCYMLKSVPDVPQKKSQMKQPRINDGLCGTILICTSSYIYANFSLAWSL